MQNNNLVVIGSITVPRADPPGSRTVIQAINPSNAGRKVLPGCHTVGGFDEADEPDELGTAAEFVVAIRFPRQIANVIVGGFAGKPKPGITVLPSSKRLAGVRRLTSFPSSVIRREGSTPIIVVTH